MQKGDVNCLIACVPDKWQLSEQYEPTSSSEHVGSVHSIVDAKGIARQQLEECLQQIRATNGKEPKNDIRKYTYSCLHKVNRS